MIKIIRKEKGISTYKLADIMTNNGFKISQSAISKIENGNKKLDIDTAKEISKALQIPVDELIGIKRIEKKIDLTFKESFYKFITDKRYLLDAKDYGPIEEYNKDFNDLYKATIEYIEFYCFKLKNNS